MSTGTAPASGERIFCGRDKTKQVGVVLGLISLVVVWMFWRNLASGDKIAITVIVCLLASMFAVALTLARRAAKKRLVVGSTGLRIESGSKSKVIAASEITRLIERRVRTGNGSYVAFFAVLLDGKEVRLFEDGAYCDQSGLLAAIEQSTSRTWEKQ